MTLSMTGDRSNTWPRSGGGTISLGELEDTAQEVAPRLWQGGRHAPKLLRRHFDVVVNLDCRAGRSVSDFFQGLYIEWQIEDADSLPDARLLHPLIELLSELHYQGKTILVHCQAGLNRSGLVCALVMRARSVSAEDAIASIRKYRDEFALCNVTFEQYVKGWEL